MTAKVIKVRQSSVDCCCCVTLSVERASHLVCGAASIRLLAGIALFSHVNICVTEPRLTWSGGQAREGVIWTGQVPGGTVRSRLDAAPDSRLEAASDSRLAATPGGGHARFFTRRDNNFLLY